MIAARKATCIAYSGFEFLLIANVPAGHRPLTAKNLKRPGVAAQLFHCKAVALYS